MFSKKYLKILVSLIVFFVLTLSVIFVPTLVQADNGWTLTTVDSTGDVGAWSSIAIGSDGFARISYFENPQINLKFVRCTNADCSTKNISIVDSSGTLGHINISLALGSDGFGRIAYYDTTNGDLKFAQCTNADCSTSNITTVDSTGNVGQYASLTLGNDGFARISYYDGTNQDLKFVQCTNASCSSTNTTTIDSTGNVGIYTSIGIGTDGFARIAYKDETNIDAKFAQCTNADCSTKNITTVASTGNHGSYINMTLANDGFARLAYRQETDNVLEFIQCTNAACSTHIDTVVDASALAGAQPSVKMGNDGYARISYRITSTQDLKYAQCTNAACSTNIITNVDTVNNVGTYSSLAIRSNGYSMISYYDVTNLDLKLALEPQPSATNIASSNGPLAAPNTTDTPQCGDSMPTKAPELFQITASRGSATLHFVPVSDGHDAYYVTYGTTPEANNYGVEFKNSDMTQAVPYTINALFSGTWYFKVRGAHGCMAGPWSKVMSVKVGFGTTTSTTIPIAVLGASTSAVTTGQCSDYIVQSGDSLWTIASNQLGSGVKYNSIMQQNNLQSDLLSIGQSLKLCN